MKHGSLLLVDDDRLVLDGMSDWLRGKGFDVAEATSCREARSLIDSTPFDLVLADIRLQDGDGFDVLAHCRDRLPEATVILVTGYATAETGIEAIRAGAFDLLTKPLIDDELELAIGRALSHRRVIEENAKLKAQLDLRFGMENVVGHDHRMLKMFDMIDSVADTRATVLITGESGTGKSLIARAIHRRSGRRDKPFVEVACGALPETLLESELFGHVAGSFTGAMGDKTGKFKQSDGGTIFLDEISTASPSMQVKLLRVLQELEFEPVGGNKTIRVDTRVILATNEDLARAVAAGRFRQDLYYRINVINIELPPLRSRLTDIPLLAAHFLARVRQETGKKVEGFSDDAMAALQAYSWPGNVRELQNVVERAVLLGKTPTINPTDLPRDLALAAPASPKRSSGRTLKEALEVPERQIILETLQQLSWNRNATAEQLGINRTTLYKKMKRLGLMGPTPAWNLAPN
ncbi:MAG: sigma-54 dependent transcriptional regulator [Pirellulaceae bacterium]|jgi:DNA-binding NtrC family response regulator|nr:sigma-54 dependent transcriptional regulator [Pirellulaceae bacterium]